MVAMRRPTQHPDPAKPLEGSLIVLAGPPHLEATAIENARRSAGASLEHQQFELASFASAGGQPEVFTIRVSDDDATEASDGSTRASSDARHNAERAHVVALIYEAAARALDEHCDFVLLPFRPIDLVAPVSPRTSPAPAALGQALFRVGNIELDTECRTIRIDDEFIPATYTEFEILRMLMQSDGRAIHREDLIEQVFGDTRADRVRRIDLHVYHLRIKLRSAVGVEIETIRHVGYRLKTDLRRR